jgi:deoxyadenosine/deoxycytidine kinase
VSDEIELDLEGGLPSKRVPDRNRKKRVNKGVFSEEELKFIEMNWRTRTDKDIGQILGRAEIAIKRQRRLHKWSKPNGRQSKEDLKEAAIEEINSGRKDISFAHMDKQSRLEIYKKSFDVHHPRYLMLKKELHPDELEYYKNKYIDFIDSVDSIHPTEEDALHHMIMCDVAISRIRKRIKGMEDAADNNDEPLVLGLYDTLDKYEKKYIEYQKALNATRSQRLSKNQEQKESIVTIVQMYRNKSVRQELGRQAGLFEIYQSKCADDMSKNRYLLGGE